MKDPEKPSKCEKCGIESFTALHGCPYAEEINDNYDPEYCQCCRQCTKECAEEI